MLGEQTPGGWLRLIWFLTRSRKTLSVFSRLQAGLAAFSAKFSAKRINVMSESLPVTDTAAPAPEAVAPAPKMSLDKYIESEVKAAGDRLGVEIETLYDAVAAKIAALKNRV